MLDWVITIPKTLSWGNYMKEVRSVADGRSVLNYHTRFFPKEMKRGDRCFVVWDGKVRGWMEIVGMREIQEPWQCSTTGAIWAPGKYIQRSGPWNPVGGPEMTGFRGIRKFQS